MDYVPWYKRIGSRIALIFIGILGVLSLLTGISVFQGFQSTQQAVSEQSVQTAFQTEEMRLIDLIQREAELINMSLTQAATLTEYSTTTLEQTYLTAPEFRSEFVLSDLAETGTGIRYDPNPDRLSDIVIFADLALDDDLERNFQYSRILDLAFAGQLDSTTNQSVVAIYYIDPQGFSRYAPVINLHDIIPPTYPVTRQIFFTVAAPEANPSREYRWTPPYQDSAGNGLLITVSSPVYENDIFRGVIGADVSLETMINNLAEFTPLDNSFAFIVDSSNHFVGGSPIATEVLLGATPEQPVSIQQALGKPIIATNNDSLSQALAAIKKGDIDAQQVTIDDRDYLLTYAPIKDVRWRLIVAVPIESIEAGTVGIVDTIKQGTNETLQNTLLILGLLMVGGLLVTFLATRRFTSPLLNLAQATTQVAAGHLDQRLDESATTELGVVSRSFNRMVEQLQTTQNDLKLVNQGLEGTITQRTQQLENERTSLQKALADLQSMTTTVTRLSTPIIPVLQGVVVVPVIGTLDQARLHGLQETMLREVQRQRVHTVILDITGLDSLDNSAVSGFIDSIEALYLLGAKPILVGVHPDVAQNLILSDIDLNELQTMPDLQAAINHVIRSHS